MIAADCSSTSSFSSLSLSVTPPWLQPPRPLLLPQALRSAPPLQWHLSYRAAAKHCSPVLQARVCGAILQGPESGHQCCKVWGAPLGSELTTGISPTGAATGGCTIAGVSLRLMLQCSAPKAVLQPTESFRRCMLRTVFFNPWSVLQPQSTPTVKATAGAARVVAVASLLPPRSSPTRQAAIGAARGDRSSVIAATAELAIAARRGRCCKGWSQQRRCCHRGARRCCKVWS